MKTTQYRLVAHQDRNRLNLEVTLLLSEGWVLYGSPVITHHGTSIGYSEYGQALTREVEVTEH